MTGLKRALEDKNFDIRLRDKLLSEGKITSSEIDKYLTGLPDETGNFEYVDGDEA